jgi:hypothetical protein
MKFFLKKIYIFFNSVGIDLLKILNFLFILKYCKELFTFLAKGGKINGLIPILGEHLKLSGSIDRHYFLLDLFIANKIYKRNPKKHLDIGSRFDGFVSHVASFRKIDVLDIRQNKNIASRVNFIQLDITKKTPNKFLNKYDSISSLHVVEHIGLGRYGDRIDPNGHFLAFNNMIKFLSKGGTFYFAVPISKKNKIYFNAHRTFFAKKIINWSNDIVLKEFHYIDDSGNFIKYASFDDNKLNNLNYGCGIYIFKKK